jgi:dTMP kinase
MESQRGKFIVFEGIDGCGKTTQIKRFVNYLFDMDKHHHIVFTRNPYKDYSIREILRSDSDPLSQAEKIADLFINDRKNQVNEIVNPFLDKGHFVLCDRFKLATFAYQSAQGLNMKELIAKHSGFPVPDITYIIDVPVSVARERMVLEEERNEQKFEKDIKFAEKVRKNYHLAKEMLIFENIFVVDGSGREEDVFGEIKEIYEREFRN